MSAARGPDYFRRPRASARPDQDTSTATRSQTSTSGIRKRFSALYPELCEVAEGVLRRLDPSAFSPQELLHEAFVKIRAEHERRELAGLSAIGKRSEAFFKACIGAACRDVLVDMLRRQGTQKRGCGSQELPLNSEIVIPDAGEGSLLDLEAALAELTAELPELAELVEARVFGQLGLGECAELFGASPRTISRRWSLAVAWLRQRLR